MGWYTEPTGGTLVTSTSTVEWNENGITLYARWETTHRHDDFSSSSAWDKTDTLPSTNSYYLTEDVTLSAVHRIPKSGFNLRICLNGHKITAEGSGAIEILNDNNIKLYDCQGTGEIVGNGKGTAISSGSDLFSNFEMYGGTIRGFATGISLPKGTFTMKGGTITGNEQGGVSARSVVMEGGEITGNGGETNTSGFGGVKVELRSNSNGDANFSMTGGKVTNNTAGGAASNIAGGVLICNAGFTMRGGEISGNRAIATNDTTRAVGGVNANGAGAQSKFVMSGGKITNNEARGGKNPVGGALGKRDQAEDSPYVEVYGTGYIYNNFAYPEQTSTDAVVSNLRINQYDMIGISSRYDGAKFGVAFDNNVIGKFTNDNNSGEDVKLAHPHFFPDIAGQYITTALFRYENYLEFVKTPPEDEEGSAKPHKHALCGEPTCTEVGHTEQTYEKSGDNYYLNANSNFQYLSVNSGETRNVCLNGYTVTTIEVKSGGTLNLCDCKGGGKAATITNEGTLNLYGGSVTTLNGTGTANLYGGSVSTARSSGTGAFLVDGATVNAMSFTGNTPIELKSGRVGSVQMNTGRNPNHKIKLTGAIVTGTITLTAPGQIDAAGLTGGPYTVTASSFPTTEGSTYALTSGWGNNTALADADPAGYFVQDSSNRYITTGTVNGVKEAVVAYTKDPDNPGGGTGSETAAHKHCSCGESLTVCKKHTEKAFSQITGTSFNGSDKYLTEDMQNLTVQSGYSNSAYLCLNGHKLGTLTVEGQVYICDCQGGGSVEKVVTKGYDSMVYLRSGSVTTMEVCAAYLYGGTVQDITVANGNSPYLYLEGAAVKGTITLGSGSKIYTDSKFTGGPYTVSLGVLTGEKSAVFTRDWSSSMKDKAPANYFISAVEGYAPAVDGATGEVLMQKQSTGTDPGGNTSGKVVIVLPDGSTVEVDPGTDGKISKEELEDAIRDKPIAPSPGQVLDKDDSGNHKWVDEEGNELSFPVDVPNGEEVVIYPQLKDCEHPNATRENEVEGTCNTQGTVDINCPDCTLITTENTGFAPHKPGADWKGGDDDNIHWKECTVCGAKADVEDHILIPQDGELQADCVKEGTQEFKCETCGRQGVELTIPALGHDFRIPHDDQNTDTHTFKCTRCDVVDTEREAHDFTANVEITKEPTTEADGILTSYCVCGASKTEPIPKLEIVDVPGSVTEGYEAAFDLNLPRAIDGLTAPGPQKAAAGDSITIPALTGTRLGYQFKGWQSDSDGQIYQPAASFTMPESPVIFSAQWERDRNGTELNPGDKLVLDDGTVIENKGGQPNTVIEVDRDGDGIPEIVITLPNGEDSVIVRPIEVPTDTDGDGENDIVIDKEIIEIPGGTQVEPNITPPGREPDPNNKDSTITVGPDGGTVDLDGEVTGGEGTTSKDKDGNEVTITDGKGTIDPDGDIDLPNGGKVETGEGEEIEIPKRVEDEEPGFVAPGEPPKHEAGGGKDDGGGDEKPSAAPVITQQPQSPGTLTEGQIPKDTTLTVGVKEPENGEITYQWYTDDPDDPTKRIPIPGANSPEYPIPEDLESGTHHYYCEVTNTEPDKAPTTVQTDEVSVIVKPKDAPGGEKVPLEPGERVEIDTDGDGKPDITVERDEDGDTVTIDKDGDGKPDMIITVPVPPEKGDVTVDKETGEVDVPPGSTIDPGGNKPEIELPDGGKVDPDNGGVTPEPGGSVVIPGGGSGGEDITITPPTDGDDDDRKVTPNPDGTVEVPGGSTVDPGGNKPEIELPDGGKVDPDGGGVTPGPGGSVVIPGGGSGGEDITITPPTDGDDDDRKVTPNPDGTVEVPKGSEITTDDITVAIQPDSPGPGVLDPDNGVIKFPDGGTVIIDKGDGPTPPIDIPAGGSVSIGDGKEPSAEPVITKQPQSPGTLTEGRIPEDTSLTVGVKEPEDGEITYQWYTDDPNDPTKRIPIPGANGPEYPIPEDLGPGTHHYYCEVTNTEPGKAPTTVKTDEVSVTVKPKDKPDGEKVPLGPGGQVEVDTDGDGKPDTTVKRDEDGDTVTIDKDGDGKTDVIITVPVPPKEGDVTVDKETGEVDVPPGSTVDPGGNKPEIELPDGGKVDPDDGGVTPGPGGSVVIPGGGSGGEDITITPPTDGDDDDRKVTPNPDGTVEVPKGSEITTDDITVAIQPDSPGPGVLDPDNDVIKFPDGGTVIIDKGDGPTPPIDIPEGGSISIGNDATNIEGTVEDTSGDAVDGADVRIQRGNIIMQRTTTGSDGLFRMYSIPGGKYNLVAEKDGKTVTKLVTLSGQTETVTLHMPSDNVNSILKVVDNTPVSGSGAKINEVVVGGLDEEAEEVRKENDGAESITVTMTVTGKAEHEAEHSQEIKRKAAGQRLEYLEIEVEKNVDGDVSKIDVTKKLLEIVIPFDFTGKENVSVYRYHDGSVDTLAERQNADEEYIEIDKTGGFITLFVRKFSTYAVGYDISEEEPPEEEEPGSPEEERPGRPARPTASSEEDHTPKIEGDEHGTVTIRPERPKPGDNVTIILTPDAGYDSDGVTVTDENGKPIPVIDNGDGTYTFTQPDGRVTIRVRFSAVGSGYDICPKDHTCPIARFDDAVPTEWYHDGVHYCLENGLMVGISENTFRPGQATSRVMIAAILWRLEGSPAVSGGKSTRFADVPDHTWYTDAVEWAASANIVSGYNRNTFGPDDLVTREQLVSMLWRYANYKGYDVSVGENTNILGYQDIAAAGDWAIPALQWAVGSRVSVGKSGNILDPQGFSTRAEAASMLQRFCSMYDV